MCNECGNCTQFCPYASEPCHDKFTLFQTAEDMAESKNPGVLFLDADHVRVRMAEERTAYWRHDMRHMFRLLAAKAVISNPQRYGFLLKREHLYPVIPHTEVNVTTSIDNLAQFAKSKGITYAQLKDANPWLRDSSLQNKSGRTYVLKIPTQAGMHYDPKKTVPHNKAWVIN